MITQPFLVYFVSLGGMASAVLFGGKTDCLVTPWSKWSEPYGFGEISREQKILRHSQGGGEPCPSESELVQTRRTGIMHRKNIK